MNACLLNIILYILIVVVEVTVMCNGLCVGIWFHLMNPCRFLSLGILMCAEIGHVVGGKKC